MTKALAALFVTVALSVFGAAQAPRIASPPGASSTEVGGRYDPRTGNVNGRWLDVRYGRPLKRGRDLFGTPDFAEFLNDGAPIWRAGANVSTELQTERAIVIAGRTIPPGEYTLFIDLKPDDRWTLIVSSWPAQTRYDTNNKEALWGAYDYTPERDIVRAPMRVERLVHSFEQLSWQFLDMTDRGGRLALIWDRKLASVAFELIDPRRSDGGR
jgi:Protein of unknown function (DUF2911)